MKKLKKILFKADIENAIRFADRATIFEVRNKVFSMHSSYEIIRHLWLENKTEITNIKVEADAGYWKNETFRWKILN